MAKGTDSFENKLTYRETLNYAILHIVKRCEDVVALCGDLESAKERFGLWFVKLRKLCEAYEIETGEQYELEAISGFSNKDL